MKKLGLLIMPLMAISLLASCGSQKSLAYATITFSDLSSNCALYCNDVGYAKGEPFKIPAWVDVTLKIKSNQDYLPIFASDVDVDGAQSYSFNLSKEEIIVRVAENENCVITANAETPKEKLDDYSWSEISQLSKMGLANKYFKVGDIKSVIVNEISHNVRIIGFNQDKDKDDNLIGITFEFANLICDKDGYSLASIWNDTENTESANYNYFSSTIHNNLNDTKRRTAKWYTIRGTKKSDVYKDSLLLMLPDDLRKAITPAKKSVNVFDNDKWTETLAVNSLFLLTPKELGYITEDLEINVPIYEYYKDCSADDDKKRQKFQIMGYEGAICPPEEGPAIESSDLLCGKTGQNLAGYEYYLSQIGKDFGNLSWLRSPDVMSSVEVPETYYLGLDGGVSGCINCCQLALSVAPAFCI